MQLVLTGQNAVIRAIPNSPLPANSVHCLRTGVSNSRVGQIYNWGSDEQSAICITPDSKINDPQNGVWGFNGADDFALALKATQTEWGVSYTNRGVWEDWGVNISRNGPVAMTVQAPDGSKWATSWREIP
jgi:hypothetical protein